MKPISIGEKKVTSSIVSNSAIPWNVVHQAPLSMEFFRQDYWSNLSSPGDLLDPGIEPGSPALQADSSPFEPPGKLPSLGEADPMTRGRHGSV